MSLGKAIDRRRLDRGWTLQILSDKCGGAIKTPSLSFIINDKCTPGIDTVEAIADALDTTVDSLLYEAKGKIQKQRAMERVKQIPIVWEQQISNWHKEPITNPYDSDVEWIRAPKDYSDSCFATYVNDDSMISQTSHAQSFPQGSLVIIDACQAPNPDSDDLSKYKADYFMVIHGNSKPILRQLIDDAGQWALKPLGKHYRSRPVNRNTRFIGKMVCCLYHF